MYTLALRLLVFTLGVTAPVFAEEARSPGTRPARTANPVVVESLTDDRMRARTTSPRRRDPVDGEMPFQAPVLEDDTTSPVEAQFQLQVLQQEVADLRGAVEELTYALQRLRKIQDERYLELDARFVALREERGTREVASTPKAPAAGRGTAAPVASGESEQALYDTALELIRNRQYDLAITQLQAVIAQYPDGPLVPNAYYWLGEVHAAKPTPDFENARQALSQVITFFPDHRKVPDAAFKLGKVYHLMGDCSRAVELLNQVITQQQGKSVGKLAETYLRDKVQCET